jgi:hypothetical protein
MSSCRVLIRLYLPVPTPNPSLALHSFSAQPDRIAQIELQQKYIRVGSCNSEAARYIAIITKESVFLTMNVARGNTAANSPRLNPPVD